MKTTRLLIVLMAIISPFLSQKTFAEIDTAAYIIQDSIKARSLIISEVKITNASSTNWNYVELANTGSEALDLSQYAIFGNGRNWTVGWVINGYETANKRNLQGMLEPGKTFLYIMRWPNNSTDPYQNRLYPDGFVNIEASSFADMQEIRGGGLPGVKVLESNVALMYRNQVKSFQDTIYPDSLYIDRFGVDNIEKDADPDVNFTIAGVNASDPIKARIYVRKFGVSKGNTVDGADPVNSRPISQWNASRGTDITDSEWLPLPHSINGQYDKVFTTLDYHGTQPDFSITSDLATIDISGKMITMPKGISRDSVFRIFETGLNHAWELQVGTDTAQFFVQEGDTIVFYTVGETLETYKFGVKLSGDDAKIAQVAPLVYKNDNGSYIKRYNISDGAAPMDTIGRLPFNTPVDTFYKYMVKEDGAKWEIVPVDGTNRPELNDGDVLKVTSADGSVSKQYHIGVESFFPSHTARINTVYFPGNKLWENPTTYVYTDTMLEFKSSTYFYSVDLPLGTTISPAIIATASDQRANVTVKRATNLSGTNEERSATIVVTAEDDTTFQEYKILFNVDRETPPVRGSLFITDIGRGWDGYKNSANISFINPSSVAIDLSEYALVTIPNQNLQALKDSYANDSNWVNNNKYILRFGSIVEPSEDLTPVFKTDLMQSKIILEAGEQYNLISNRGYPLSAADTKAGREELVKKYVHFVTQGIKGMTADKSWTEFYGPDVLGTVDPYGTDALPFRGGNGKIAAIQDNSLGLARILNDSVKDGTKHVMKDFESDYEWVDLAGGPAYDISTGKLYDNDTVYMFNGAHAKTSIYRKPHIYTGNPVDGSSYGTGVEETMKTINPSEWVIYGLSRTLGGGNYDEITYQRFGNHTVLSYAHIPYLTSGIYIVEEGLTEKQQIFGVSAGTSFDQFLNNVNKADSNMIVKAFAADNSELNGTDVLIQGINVWSWSASGFDSVNYVINVGSLSTDCALSSSKFTVNVSVPSGTISGIPTGTTLEDLLKELTAPDYSQVVVTDGGEQVVPLMKYNKDTVALKGGELLPTIASTRTYVEVIAQDNVTKCIYSLEFAAEDVPYILSDVYVVDQASKTINFVDRTSPTVLISNLVPSAGASIKVVNKYDQMREFGTMEYSDRVIVTKGEVSVQYWVKYTVNEEVIGVPVKEIASKGLSIYPNPATDFVTVHGASGSFVEVRDLTGKLLMKQILRSSDTVIDLRKMKSGIYIVTVEDTSFKVVKN